MSAPEANTGPDEVTLRADIAGAGFQMGLDERAWRLIELDWPHALIGVSAAARDNAPKEFILRFELSGYPQSAPTSCLWDLSAGAMLDPASYPKGERAVTVFRADWEGGRGLYAPWDRLAIETHDPSWVGRFPLTAWNQTRQLSFYLRNVHDLLNADDYVGI
jgi:hypothetical protein